MNVDIGTAVLIVVGIAGMKVIDELVKIFFQRMRTKDFVTKEDCNRCSKKGIEADDQLEKQLLVIKRMVMAMAIKMGVDTKEIQEMM